MTYEELMTALDSMADPSLARYQNVVISDTRYPARCIRVPELRKLAKRAATGDWRELVRQGRYETYEEVLVIGLTIAYSKVPFREKTDELRLLLPRLDSWALTDSIVPTLKLKSSDREAGWIFAMECLDSPLEYTVRFGIILLLDYYLTPDDIFRAARALCDIRDQRYYVQMGIAWCLAEMGVHDFELVEKVLKEQALDTFTHNMTIRKLRESYRIPPEQKAVAAALKRKEQK